VTGLNADTDAPTFTGVTTIHDIQPASARHLDDPIEVERTLGVRRSIGHLLIGNRGRAHYELTRSVMRQARMAGLGTPDLSTPCLCGGRCGR
jgi:hypothetical protein